MRRLGLGNPLNDKDIPWAIRSLKKIDRATAEDIETIFDAFTIEGDFIELRTLDAAAGSLADVRNFIATLVTDVKRRGQHRES